MESRIIREKFLSFFKEKRHRIVPSAPIVVQNDPTLMFTNAGMNQFKDYFLGNKEAEFVRVADTQKCLRVSGKHNDLEEVGFDTYHHTMFEMLGNWSFGDYFKEEAIAWAWELLTEVYGLPVDRLYVTVFEGDNKEDLAPDEESFGFWKDHIAPDRILDGSKKDNFWEMGDTGPCGPCSEIHIDLRPEQEVKDAPGKNLVNQDHPLVVEIWNLVFIQFNRLLDGSLRSLPQKHVDTGMGFERLAMAIQGKASNYDTDVFQPMIQDIASRAKVDYGRNEKTDIALRVIADHIRAIAFAIGDGQLPSNNKAGYVIRRILRRAVRYGYTFLDFRTPVLHDLIPKLADQFREVFPELKQQEEFVAKVIREEEVSFLRTLENGLKRFESLKGTVKNGQIDGPSAFELYDTFGFPLDLTSLIARENGLTVDQHGFETEMQRQKDRSRSAAKQDTGDWVVMSETSDHSEFVGYEHLKSESRVTRYRQVKEKGKTYYQIVLDRTPFYAESGGQVGDTGTLAQGNDRIDIYDTRKENDLIIHLSAKLPKELDRAVQTQVDAEKRLATENNHSATHLLHAALRDVLGDHVQQRGSLVNDKLLRFDFSHFTKMTDEEIEQVEQEVNGQIRKNIQRGEQRNVPIARAKDMGAMALFGEKYGDFVRVITFDPNYSVELCGGCHVPETGRIGLFKIISESSIAAGIRRIEAITSLQADAYIAEKLATLEELDEVLKHPKDLVKAVGTLLNERQQLSREVEGLHREMANSLKADMKQRVTEVGGTAVLFYKGQFPSNDVVKQVAFDLRKEIDNLILLIAADVAGKPNLTLMFSDQLVSDKDLHAGNMIRDLAKHIKGGGGGQPFYATAGGKEVSGLDAALTAGEELLKSKVGVEA